jgi:hypothetical protein
MLAAAGRFGELLRSAYAASYARYEGFRSGNGVAGDWPAAFGLTRSGPHVLAPPSPAEAATALHTWQQLSLGVRALALIDTSAAMTARARPGGPDLEQQLARVAGDGLALSLTAPRWAYGRSPATSWAACPTSSWCRSAR